MRAMGRPQAAPPEQAALVEVRVRADRRLAARLPLARPRVEARSREVAEEVGRKAEALRDPVAAVPVVEEVPRALAARAPAVRPRAVPARSASRGVARDAAIYRPHVSPSRLGAPVPLVVVASPPIRAAAARRAKGSRPAQSFAANAGAYAQRRGRLSQRRTDRGASTSSASATSSTRWTTASASRRRSHA